MKETSSVEENVRNSLIKLNFDVVENIQIENYFNADLIAKRDGLTIVVEVEKSEILSFDSVAKLQTLSTILIEKYKPIALRKILFTTSDTVSPEINQLANENDILLLQVKPQVDNIENVINGISFLKPIPREEVNIMRIVGQELKSEKDEQCLELLSKIEVWYNQGGKTLVNRKIKNEIDRIVE